MVRILSLRQAQPLLQARTLRLAEAERVVRPIIEAVRKRGDRALIQYARKFDGLRGPLRLSSRDLRVSLPGDLRRAVVTAEANIRRFAELQLPKPFVRRLSGGQIVGQIVRPLETIAAYIPAGRYPLPSTLLMTAVPARVAGVANICVACPNPSREILGIASHLRLDQFFRVGGAHAIAAFAFGTDTVPKADRIVGPGSIWVAAAKKLLAGEVAIDFVAGPTEIVILAEDGDPSILAADMLAQAEHDVDASAILVTTSRRLASGVAAEIERQLQTLPTAAVAAESVKRNAALVVTGSLPAALDLVNRLAPEHLSIPTATLLDRVQNAGSVFIGPHSPEAAGDYATGPNHVLPTCGAARHRGGLSVTDFVKVISTQQLTRRALRGLAPAITTLARAEGLEAHARSIEMRLHE